MVRLATALISGGMVAKTRGWVRIAAAAVALAASGCTVGPDYLRPTLAVPAAFKEAPRQDGWKAAAPADGVDRGAWWSIYDDPVLDGLERQVAASNQTVAQAAAAFRNATALADASGAALYPTLSASAGADRSGPFQRKKTGSGTSNSVDLGLTASWVPDLWGKVARSVEAGNAAAAVSAADLANARLAAEASLASDYFQLRTEDELKSLLDATIVAYDQALTIARNRYNAGTAPQSDVISAQTLLESTRAQAIAVGVVRAQLEHAIAVLIGKAPSELAIASGSLTATVPDVPVGLPSTLLERRPDIAAAERQVAEANAEIGVAIAAYYPDLTLTGSLSAAAPAVAGLMQAQAAAWAIGSQLAAKLFDGGAREAEVRAARATFDQDAARYRQTVLAAFQQVEDELAAQRILAQQAVVEDGAVALAKQAERLMLNQYQAGTEAYSSVLTAETTALAEQQKALSLRQSRLLASAALIEALGGGWTTAALEPVKPAP